MSSEIFDSRHIHTTSEYLIAATIDNDRYLLALVVRERHANLTRTLGTDRLRIQLRQLGILGDSGFQQPRRATTLTFEMTADVADQTLKVGSIYLPEELRGKGLGSFAFNELIGWAQAHYREYTVLPLKLSEGDGKPPNGPLRNRFYRRLGFRLGFVNDKEEQGWSERMPASEFVLTPPSTVRSMEVQEVLSAMGKRHIDLDQRFRSCEEDRKGLEARLVRASRWNQFSMAVGLLALLWLILR